MEKGDELGLRREKDRKQFVTCSESPLWARSVLAGLQSGGQSGEDAASEPESGGRLTKRSAGGRSGDGGVRW